MSDGIKFEEPKYGEFTTSIDEGTTLRLSTTLKKLREAGEEKAAKALEADHQKFGSSCPKHGKLEDPIIGLLGARVGFACPWCSGPAVLAAWEKEGKS